MTERLDVYMLMNGNFSAKMTLPGNNRLTNDDVVKRSFLLTFQRSCSIITIK